MERKQIEDKIDSIYQKLNTNSFSKFADIIASPRKIFWRSFLSGIAKGIGMAVGFSILGAIVIYLLRYFVLDNITFFRNMFNS